MSMIRLALAATAFALATGPASAEMKREWVDYSHGGMKLKAYTVYDDSKTGRRPAVFVVPARGGMSAQALKLTEIWAKLGYVSFAADIFGYGEGILPKSPEESQALTSIYRNDRALMKARTQAGFDTMLKSPLIDPAKIALVGYCFGGDVGVEFGSTGAPLLANVAIHGSFDKNYAAGWAKNAKGMFLILHGAEDEGYPLPVVGKVVDDLRAAKTPFQLEVYSGTGHGFSAPKNKAEERANDQSIAATARTFKELFGI
jgi:dienelactone hydrolase